MGNGSSSLVTKNVTETILYHLQDNGLKKLAVNNRYEPTLIFGSESPQTPFFERLMSQFQPLVKKGLADAKVRIANTNDMAHFIACKLSNHIISQLLQTTDVTALNPDPELKINEAGVYLLPDYDAAQIAAFQEKWSKTNNITIKLNTTDASDQATLAIRLGLEVEAVVEKLDIAHLVTHYAQDFQEIESKHAQEIKEALANVRASRTGYSLLGVKKATTGTDANASLLANSYGSLGS